jgi:tRNA (guanine-N7-)-methyltransferase
MNNIYIKVARKKLIRFEEINKNENVLQEGKEHFHSIKGNWNSIIFQNQKPIVLELGCGKGEYTVGLGKIFPEKNFIGIDIKGDRLAVGSNDAIEAKLNNVAFLRLSILELEKLFDEGEVSEIWITFPDPQPRIRNERRRLTSKRFLDIYANILTGSGKLNLKTDNEVFFNFSIEQLKNIGVSNLTFTKDLYNSEYISMCHGIQTNFEKKYLLRGQKINYLNCSFPK